MNEDADRDLLIALSLLPFLTPNRTRLLRENFVPLYTSCNAPSSSLATLLKLTAAQAEQVRNPFAGESRALVAALREHVVTLADDAYPPRLREIADPPLVLHLRGDVSSLSAPAIAVVGSRRASPYAVNVAQKLSRELASAGLTIVSGLARGVDAAAHQACLDAGGRTVAVLGTGIETVYPRSHVRLAAAIQGRGALVTEFSPSTPPLPENFPVRNRLISGLSAGVVVVEAGGRSGSLITARMAAEQGRDVFAVPGSIYREGSEGTHRLIQSGAKLVHDTSDILEELQLALPSRRGAEDDRPPGEAGEVLAVLDLDEPSHVDELALRLGRSTASLAGALLELELSGWVRTLPGARFVRAR